MGNKYKSPFQDLIETQKKMQEMINPIQPIIEQQIELNEMFKDRLSLADSFKNITPDFDYIKSGVVQDLNINFTTQVKDIIEPVTSSISSLTDYLQSYNAARILFNDFDRYTNDENSLAAYRNLREEYGYGEMPNIEQDFESLTLKQEKQIENIVVETVTRLQQMETENQQEFEAYQDQEVVETPKKAKEDISGLFIGWLIGQELSSVSEGISPGVIEAIEMHIMFIYVLIETILG